MANPSWMPSRLEPGFNATPLSSDDLRRKLEHALDSITWKGSFVATADDKEDPDIFVNDVGPIRLPLSELQAKDLVNKSHQAPFGKGSETIVDTSVRNTWELNPDQFQIRNPQWNAFLDKLLQKMAGTLGIHAPVSAELYKMLLYEKGAMFKAHTDTEKIPGMFGTLVICLPSPHEGGDVILRHGGQVRKFTSSTTEMSSVSWYSDVSHEVLPVTSGYRFVLTYNLAMDSAAALPSATALLRDQSRELRQALESWSHEVKTGRREAEPLYYVLEHKYTEANISLKHLKTIDQARVQCLQMLCSELDFDLFLTTLEKKDIGTAEGGYGYDKYDDYYDEDDEEEDDDEDGHHDIEDIIDTEYTAKFIFDLAGNKIVSSVEFGEDDVIQEDAFGDEPDKEEYEGYMGNSGPTATHWYRQSAAIIVPSQRTLSFLTRGMKTSFSRSDDTAGISKYYINRCIAAPRDGRGFQIVHQLLQHFWKPSHYAPSSFTLSGATLDNILRLCLLRNETALFDLIFTNNKKPVPISFLGWLKGKVNEPGILWENIQKATCHCVRSQSTLSQRYQAIQALTEATEGTEKLELLVSRAVDDTLNNFRSDKTLSEEDGVALFNLSLYYRDVDSLKTLGFQVVESRGDQISFFLGFLRTLRQSTKRKQIPQEEGRRLYEDLTRIFLYHMNLKTATATKTPEPPKTTSWGILPSTIQDTKSPGDYVNPEALVRFLSSLFEDNLGGHLQIFPHRITLEARLFQAEAFNSLWIPVFQDLTTLLEKHRTSLTTPLWRGAYQSLLRQYLLIFVGKEPQKHNVAIRRVSCRCGDCSALNSFLANPGQRIGRFPVGKQRRQHLHRQLDDNYIDCTHETDRRGNPQTLVVTKTSKHFDNAAAKWSQRRLQAESQLSAFDQAKLRVLLSDQYDEIMDMKFLLPVVEPDPPFPTASTSAFGSPSTYLPRHDPRGRGTAAAPTPPSSGIRSGLGHSARIGTSMLDPNPRVINYPPTHSTHDHRPSKRLRTGLDPPRAVPANPTLQQLAELDAEIARSAGAPPPQPPKQATPQSRSTASRPGFSQSSTVGNPSSFAAGAVRAPPAVGSRTPFRPINNGRSTWRGGGMGSSPTTTTTTTGTATSKNSGAVRRPTTTMTTMIGSKRKIVDVIDLTEDD